MMGFDLLAVIKSAGYLGILASVILENGVLLCFFLPSDSMLLAAGFMASQGILDLNMVIFVCIIGGILGYMLGYYLGNKTGTKIFEGKEDFFEEKEYLKKAMEMHKKYENLALVTARFFPIRAFISYIAGASRMDYKTFMFYNVLGAILWVLPLTLIGYHFGEFISPEDLDGFLVVFVVFIVVIATMVPVAMHILKSKNKKPETGKK